MNYEASPVAVAVFLAFVGLTLGLSFYLGRQGPVCRQDTSPRTAKSPGSSTEWLSPVTIFPLRRSSASAA